MEPINFPTKHSKVPWMILAFAMLTTDLTLLAALAFLLCGNRWLAWAFFGLLVAALSSSYAITFGKGDSDGN